MNKNKIMLIFGTRPEAIKMAPLYHTLVKDSNFDVKICITAQHREMLDQALDIFEIIPDFDLNIMKAGQDLFDITVGILSQVKSVLLKETPDLVLVHGDTTTMLSAALAAFYLNIPVGHIEAGLRTFDTKAPFPEEANRQLASRIVTWHFSPTDTSRQNLINEGIDERKITVTGNTVIDSLFWVLRKIETNFELKEKIISDLNSLLDFNWVKNKFVLITGHRRENFGVGFLEICSAIKSLALKYKDINFVYPVHLNPNVNGIVSDLLKDIDNIHLITPLNYEPFVYLLKHSYLVLTDSGGIQEEAPSLGKPVLVMRDVTERPEAVLAGTVRLVGANSNQIIQNMSEIFDEEEIYCKMSQSHNPYGEGNSCVKIYEFLKNVLNEK
jgi:UDP-N-acetylglucosamine 2-epimerase (non-hydrolysing)